MQFSLNSILIIFLKTMLINNMIMYIHHNVHHIIQTQLFKDAVKSAM